MILKSGKSKTIVCGCGSVQLLTEWIHPLRDCKVLALAFII